MANCAPRQLAASLPQIVPKLVDAVSDPHPKVKDAARQAMADITGVIKNPEISQLIPVLLAALGDPANRTKDVSESTPAHSVIRYRVILYTITGFIRAIGMRIHAFNRCSIARNSCAHSGPCIEGQIRRPEKEVLCYYGKYMFDDSGR
jgi:hypothetical protein